MSKNILVTGGAGYIGSHTCKALAKCGYTPVVYDNLVNGHSWAVKWGALELGDIADRIRLDAVIEQYKPMAIMHFAAHAYVGESVENPGKYYRNNVAGTLTLLEAMRDHRMDKFIFSSTCATYGVPAVVPIKEDQQQNPINPYGSSKLMIEKILKDFDKAHSIRSISLRYFNAAGADPEADIGEAHEPETHLIPLILDVAAGDKSEIKIYGDDYSTEDGTCVRDYIHVCDLADAHVLALKSLLNNGETTAYNLGNGNGYSVKQIISFAETVVGKKLAVRILNRRDGDPPILVGDSRRIVSELGWKPKFNSLADIIETAWHWRQKRYGN